MPVDEDAFDKSIHDAFHGTGKQRTALSGMFLVVVDKLLRTQGYQAVTAWEEDDSIIVCVEKPDDDGFWQSMMGANIVDIQADINVAALDFVESYIDFDVYGWNTPLWKSDVFDALLATCEAKAPDAIPILKETCGKYWRAAAVEIGYWHEHHEILDWFTYLQEVIQENDSLIYVYKPVRRRWKIGDPVIPKERPQGTEPLLPGDTKKLQ